MKSESVINPEFDLKHFFDQQRRRRAWRAGQARLGVSLTDAQRRGFTTAGPFEIPVRVVERS